MRRTPKLSVCERYEIYNGQPVAVLLRDKTTNQLEPCPFCSAIHIHAYPDGHRNTHCGDNITYRHKRGISHEVKLTPNEIIAKDGTVLQREHGYIIRTKPEKP